MTPGDVYKNKITQLSVTYIEKFYGSNDLYIFQKPSGVRILLKLVILNVNWVKQ